LGDEVVSHADEAAQRLGLVGERHQRAEAVTVRTQQVREQVRIAPGRTCPGQPSSAAATT
jgi:hypothetical protein